MAWDELELVEWLRQQQGKHPGVGLGIGDDMAAVRTYADLLLISSDMLLDSVHFDTVKHKLEQIGRKAIACSLSDCAAMAVRPLGATVSVALPAAAQADPTPEGGFDAKALFRGMFAIAAEHDLAIVGGDITRWKHPLAIDVAITATPFDGIDPVTRSGARPRDTLYVTGPLGGSLLGRHMTFTPRVDEAKAIAEALGAGLHAMIDISDGLSLDLWRMCEASGVGAILDENDLQWVISEDARVLAAGPEGEGRTALDHLLSDGEDFELLLAVAGGSAVPGVQLHRVGSITDSDLCIRGLNGRVEPLEPKGFLH
ncbi:MAG: thiamine-phosphate kinase [Planctomycetota bacterium]|jgi:thiamine-monophosphate kinase